MDAHMATPHMATLMGAMGGARRHRCQPHQVGRRHGLQADVAVLRGTLIAESLRLDQPFDTDALRVQSVRRVGPLDGVAADQPDVWTFIEFTADDARGGTLADALRPP